jgi:uncharacterized membrane protein YqaE (UPF0057 family)
MRKQTLNLWVAIIGIAAFGLSSCSTDKGLSVTKRKYRGGYHVEWNGTKQKKQSLTHNEMSVTKEAAREIATIEKMEKKKTTPVLASSDNAIVPYQSNITGANTEIDNPITVDKSELGSSISELSKSEMRQLKKEIKTTIRQEMKTATENGSSDMPMWALIIITILLPPLGVGLALGFHKEFWITLLLWLLFYFPGLIYALIKIL